MNILVIGGTGVLSSAVVNEAQKQGIGVTMINRGHREIPSGVEFIKSEKKDYARIAYFLRNRRFDAIMDYLLYSDGETKKSVEFYTKYTNQYFYISSCAVYNTKELAGAYADEDSPKELSIWNYSVNKWASELMVKSLFSKSSAHYTVIRPCVTYGDTRIPYGISPKYGYHWTLVARILNNKPIITWNGGVNRCNMTRVEDFAVGVVGLIGNPKAYNEVFNVCGDEVPSFNEVLDCIAEVINHPVHKIDIDGEFYASQIPYRRGELLGGRSIDSLNSNSKLKVVVPSFVHTYTLKEGIEKTINAYEMQSFQYGIDWRFEGETDRTIKKWCKENNIKLDKSTIRFIDYLGNANIIDRFEYWCALYNVYGLFSFVNRVKNKIKGFCK